MSTELKQKLSKFFEEKTDDYNSIEDVGIKDTIDSSYIFCASAKSFICTIKNLLEFVKDFNPITIAADDPKLLFFGQIVYFIANIYNEENAIIVYLPAAFCDKDDTDLINDWRNGLDKKSFKTKMKPEDEIDLLFKPDTEGVPSFKLSDSPPPYDYVKKIKPTKIKGKKLNLKKQKTIQIHINF